MRKSLERAGVALASALLGLLLVEVGYRVHVWGLRGLSMEKMNSVSVMGKRALLRESPYSNPPIRYLLAPDVERLFKMQPFRTNSRGLRDEEYSLAKPEGVRRIAVVGDSFVMGSGVALEDLFHTLLEESLAESYPGTRFQCLNFGVGGHNLADYYATVRHMVGAYEPDLVLVGLSMNDQYPPGHAREGRFVTSHLIPGFWRLHALEAAMKGIESRRAAKGEADAEGRALGAGLFRLAPQDGKQERGSRARGARTGRAPGQAAMGHEAETEEEMEEFLESVDHAVGNFTALRYACASLDVPLVLVHLNVRHDHGPLRATKVFQRAAYDTQLRLLDTTDLFRKEDLLDLVIFPNDYHPNARANRVFAAAIHEFLIKRRYFGEPARRGQQRTPRTDD